MRSFEEDALLERPPPDFSLGQEYWLGLQVFIREKLWRLYRLYNPSTMDDEELSRMMEAIARGRKKLAEKKAREVFGDLQSRLDEAARRLWNEDHTRNARRSVSPTQKIGSKSLIRRKRLLPAVTSTKPMISIISSVKNGERRR